MADIAEIVVHQRMKRGREMPLMPSAALHGDPRRLVFGRAGQLQRQDAVGVVGFRLLWIHLERQLNRAGERLREPLAPGIRVPVIERLRRSAALLTPDLVVAERIIV